MHKSEAYIQNIETWIHFQRFVQIWVLLFRYKTVRGVGKQACHEHKVHQSQTEETEVHAISQALPEEDDQTEKVEGRSTDIDGRLEPTLCNVLPNHEVCHTHDARRDLATVHCGHKHTVMSVTHSGVCCNVFSLGFRGDTEQQFVLFSDYLELIFMEKY